MVEAQVIDGVDFSANIGEGNGFSVKLEFADATGGKFSNLCCAKKSHVR